MRPLFAFTLLALAAPSLSAQPKAAEPTPGDVMIDAYLASQTDILSKKFLDGAKTLPEWTAKRPQLHRDYLDMLGLPPLTDKTPLKAAVTRTFENQGVVIDNLHFQSRPGLYVTANLYRPKDNTKKLPTVLYLCGHSKRGRDGNKSAFQDHGLWFAANGYNCLVLDTLQLGEIPGIHLGTYFPKTDRRWWYSAGYTPAAVECWNGIRAVDYLLTRADVDPDKLGISGISGGGAATIWIAAADDRLKVVAPISGMADLESYVKNKVINSHCDCMFLPNAHQWDWSTILALVAPRPLLFGNSDKDNIFPMDANRRVAAKMRTIYGLYGKENLTDEYVSSGGHDYRPDLRVAIFKFFNKHLKGEPAAAVEDSAAFATIPGKDLRVFPTDDDLPADRLNDKIDETFVARGTTDLPAKDAFETWRAERIQRVRERSFKSLPTKVPAARLPGGALGWMRVWVEGNVESEILQFAVNEKKSRDAVLVVADIDEHLERKTAEDLERIAALQGGLGFALFPRGLPGTPAASWTQKYPPNSVERSHMLLGTTVDAGRVRDILATRIALREFLTEKYRWKVVGAKQAGILSAYAALFDPEIAEIVLHNPTTSHKAGPHFPGILRELDIPDALGLLAPRLLTIVGDDPAFDRTAEIYRLAGAADKLKRVK